MDNDPTASLPVSPDRRVWLAIFATIVLAHWVSGLPIWLYFSGFAFGDPGASLTTHDVVNRGLRPAIDFAHHYGLLGILLGKPWFAVFGATPWAFLLAMLGFGFWMAWSLASLATDRPTGRGILLLTAASVPYWIQACYPNLAHGLEAGLLCHAMREHSRGRRPIALALATAALFAKPSLGFPYGLILLIDLAISMRGRWRVAEVLGKGGLGPALAVGIGLLLVCSLVFGVEVTIRTLIPTTGISTYKAGNFGFFRGVGSGFWYRPGFPLGYYFGSVVAYWIVATLILCAGGIFAVLGSMRGRGNGPTSMDGEMTWSLAALHAFFVTMLFGHMYTWVYDSFVLGAGLVTLSRLGSGWRRGLTMLLVLVILGHYGGIGAMRSWKERARTPETFGLWDDAIARDDWSAVRPKLVGKSNVLLSTTGCLEHLEPGLFVPPVGVFIVPGTEDSVDALKKAEQVREAESVLVPWTMTTLQDWPMFRAGLEGRPLVHDGPRFRLYGRAASR